MDKRKTSRTLLIVGMSLVLVLFSLLICDFFLVSDSKINEWIYKFIELLTTAGGSISLSIGFSMKITERSQNNITSLRKSNNNEIVQNNGAGKIIVDKSINNDPVTMVEAVKECLVPYQQSNIEAVAKKTCEVLLKDRPVGPIDKDFLIKYLSESAIISNTDIQDIWVKLLVQNTKKSGSVSKRTLDIVKNLSSDEARLFQDVASYSFEEGTISKSFLQSVPFMKLSVLQDIGLLKSGDFISQNFTLAPTEPLFQIESNILFRIDNKGNDEEKISDECYVLTAEGLELKNALGISISQENFLIYAKRFQEKNSDRKTLCFGAYHIISRQDNNVTYDDKNLLLSSSLSLNTTSG